MSILYYEPYLGLGRPHTERMLYGSYTKNMQTQSVLFENSAFGAPNKNWRDRIAKHQAVTGPFTRNWIKPVDGQDGFFDFRVKSANGWSRAWGWYSPTTLTAPVDNSYNEALCQDIAVSKLKRKIASDKEDYAVLTNLVQDVYQFRRTIHGTLDSIYELLLRLRVMTSQRRLRPRALLQNVADLYLGFVFGINPTIQDAIDLAKSIDAYVNRTDHVKRFTASHQVDAIKGFSGSITPVTGMKLHATSGVVRVYSVRFISGHILNLKSGMNYGLSDHFHLAPTDFIPMAWELLPWSWVLDYVATIGPFLEDRFQSVLDTSFYNVRDIRIHRLFHESVRMEPLSGYVATSRTRCIRPRLLDYGTFERSGVSELPGRMLRLRTKYEIDRNLTSKILNLASVLIARSR